MLWHPSNSSHCLLSKNTPKGPVARVLSLTDIIDLSFQPPVQHSNSLCGGGSGSRGGDGGGPYFTAENF